MAVASARKPIQSSRTLLNFWSAGSVRRRPTMATMPMGISMWKDQRQPQFSAR